MGYEGLRRFVDHFLFGFLILLLVFDLVRLALKRFGVIKVSVAVFCSLCVMLYVAARIIFETVLEK